MPRDREPPDGAALTVEEAAALAAARALIGARKREGRHHVAATVLTASGRAYTANNLESVLGRAAICAEAVAIGMATTAEAEAEIVFAVAVNRRGEVIPPCGMCRELLLDFGPDARIGVPTGDAPCPDGTGAIACPLADLVPHAYKADRRGAP
ncbi:MAG: cytidine deaminase [Pseudomonadota bacterium]